MNIDANLIAWKIFIPSNEEYYLPIKANLIRELFQIPQVPLRADMDILYTILGEPHK